MPYVENRFERDELLENADLEEAIRLLEQRNEDMVDATKEMKDVVRETEDIVGFPYGCPIPPPGFPPIKK